MKKLFVCFLTFNSCLMCWLKSFEPLLLGFALALMNWTWSSQWSTIILVCALTYVLSWFWFAFYFQVLRITLLFNFGLRLKASPKTCSWFTTRLSKKRLAGRARSTSSRPHSCSGSPDTLWGPETSLRGSPCWLATPVRCSTWWR